MDTNLLRKDALYPPSKSEEERMREAMHRLEKANDDLFTRNDQLTLRLETIKGGFDDKVETLARAYTMLKDGDTRDGLYELERVLDQVDSGWRVLA